MSLKRYFGRQRTEGSKRGKQGVSTVVGAVFFFVIAITLISFFYEVAENHIIMQQYDAQKVEEKLNFELQVLSGGNLLLIVKNNGPIPAEIIRIWVVDIVENNHTSYPQNLSQTLGIEVAPWERIYINSTEAPLNASWIPLSETHTYSIRIVTARGNIIEQDIIRGITGESRTLTTYPPWVSTSETNFSTNPSETPVPQISRDDKGNPYKKGSDVWLSIKNTGTITFFLTVDTKIVFYSEADGKVYAARLKGWKTFRWDGNKWVKDDEGPVEDNKDSLAVYPGNVIVLKFDTPKEAPGHSNTAPSGTYRIYLHVEGYDQTGKTFFQDVYYGEISF